MPKQLLPGSPHLDHLKKQARELLRSYADAAPDAFAMIREFHPEFTDASDEALRSSPFTLVDAQLVIARHYSFSSWAKMKWFVETDREKTVLPGAQRLKEAIDQDDIDQVRHLLQADPGLIYEHVSRGRSGYKNHRPLTYACAAKKIDVVRVLLEAGADIHEDGNLAAARCRDVEILELLHEHGLDVNCRVYTWGPFILCPCENRDVDILRWLLDHGADPNLTDPAYNHENALSMTIACGIHNLHDLVNLLIDAGADAGLWPPGEMAIYRNRMDLLTDHLNHDPTWVHEHLRFGWKPDEDRFHLRGYYATPLHVAAMYNNLEAADILLAHGADVNARALPNEKGYSTKTPIYETFQNPQCYSMTEWLINHGADLSLSARVFSPDVYRWNYEAEDIIDVTPLGYVLLLEDGEHKERLTALLKQHGAKP